MFRSTDFVSRFKAAGVHSSICAVIAMLVAVLVFGVWFPWPYRVISGGQHLFTVLVSVDLVLGPLLTFVIFNSNKSRKHLQRDLAVIALLQIAGLAYGIYTLYEARPVVLVYEVDRFRVINNSEVLQSELQRAPLALRTLSLTGPRLLGSRRPESPDERFKAIEYAIQGYDVGARPRYWQPYRLSAPSALERARPLAELYKKYAAHKADIEQTIRKTGLKDTDFKFLPLTGKNGDWSILLNAKTGMPVGFLPYDGYI